jgi:large subunit ribosomal protein L19e
MSNLRLQKRLAASILKCGRHKIWLDPNEKNEIQMSTTRTAVRKLIHDGYVIKKPQKVHSRFRARQRAMEKKKGRHLGKGSRKGTREARNPSKLLWIKRQRAMRRLLRRYKESGKIDRRMYHRLYLKAKGGSFKNRANLIENIDSQLQEKKRNQALLEQYKLRREAALRRKRERELQRQKELKEQAKIAEEAEKMVVRSRTKPKPKPSGEGGNKKRRGGRKKQGGGNQQQSQTQPQQQQQQQGNKKRRRRKRNN